ncbi:glutathione S-transferase [Undibacterium sp. SXout7W]|uniref:glutathione S-transferase n=1 Tax=Undibacterium sp. SXout7W TaxID=3413049 RepID=UPI003BF34453
MSRKTHTQAVRPLLYSFRRCPYAIRARLAIWLVGVDVELQEVSLRNKPPAMLEASPKGTVPVLVLPEGRVIDQSLDIMCWALRQMPDVAWFTADGRLDSEAHALIVHNDTVFKKALDQYKYPERYPDAGREYYQEQIRLQLRDLNERLARHRYLCGEQIGIADLALVSFVRQCAGVDMEWFNSAPFPLLHSWLSEILTSELFEAVMQK